MEEDNAKGATAVATGTNSTVATGSSDRKSTKRANNRSNGCTGERERGTKSSGKKRDKTISSSIRRKQGDVNNGTETALSGTKQTRTLRKSVSMNALASGATGAAPAVGGPSNKTNAAFAKDKDTRKTNRRRTSSVEPSSRVNSRSRSASPRRSLTNAPEGVKLTQASNKTQEAGDNDKTKATTPPSTTQAEPSQTSSTLDASTTEGKQRSSKKTKSTREASRRRILGEPATKERKSSRRSLLMDSSSRKQTGSRINMSDGSSNNKEKPKFGMSDTSQGATLDASRVSSSSMEASTKDTSAIGGSKRRSLLEAARERPSMKDVSSRRKMMTESSERHSSMLDIRQHRQNSNEPNMGQKPKSKIERGLSQGSKSRKASLERTGSSRRTSSAAPNTGTAPDPDDIPEMKKFDTAEEPEFDVTEETVAQGIATPAAKRPSVNDSEVAKQNNNTSGGNKAEINENKFDTMGFPMFASSNEKGQTADFGHLPDFQVDDFSFGDLKFPFDSNEGGKEVDGVKVDNAKAAELSSKEEAKHKQQQEPKRAEEQPQEEPQTPPPTSSSGHWTCTKCQEEHDEAELQFCGMCGAKRPKTTPKQKKAIRKSGGHETSSKRESTSANAKKTIRRSNTMQDQQQQQEDSGSRSGASRKSAPSERPSSTGAIRKIRSRDKPGLTTTPRARSKGKVRPGTSGKDKEMAMIVKCLDGEEAEAVDMEMLNQQLTTFASLEDPPMTPMRSKKKSIRRSQSDVAEKHGMVAGRTPTSAAPQTPKSLGKKKLPLKRSQSFADRPATPGGSGVGPGLPPMMRKPSVRQAIPRRAISSTTEYLQQLQQNQHNLDASGHSVTNQGSTTNSEELKTQSAHSMGTSQSLGALGGRPSLAGKSMMKQASQRLLGGLSGIASSTFAIGGAGVSNVMGNMPGMSNVMGSMPGISPFTTKPKGDALLLNDDDDDDDNDEFASELQKNQSANDGVAMLRDFPSVDIDVTKSPRAPRSSRNLMDDQDDDALVTQTPRRRRATIASARQSAQTPRRRRGGSVEARAREEPDTAGRRGRGVINRSSKRGGLPLTDDEDTYDRKSIGSGALDYDDIDIDEGDGEEETGGESSGFGATPRRARARLGRAAMERRQAPGASLAKSDHGAVTPKGLNARSRIRRASLTGFQVGALPDLDATEISKPPATPGTLNARSRIRRASLGAMQMPTIAAPEPEPEAAVEEHELVAGSSHGRAARSGRPGRARARRGSIETRNPLLQQALAQMPQDPTHAVRSDLQEEWKRQEQMEDMRKKAKELHKRYGAGALSSGVQPESAPLFDAEFDNFDQGASGQMVDEGEESGADLELPDDAEDVSDLSSHDGDEFAG